jgi:hypothetical protein
MAHQHEGQLSRNSVSWDIVAKEIVFLVFKSIDGRSIDINQCETFHFNTDKPFIGLKEQL